AFAHGPDGCEAAGLQFVVDVASREVVEYHYLVSEFAEVEAGRPAAETVATKYEDLHKFLQEPVVAIVTRFLVHASAGKQGVWLRRLGCDVGSWTATTAASAAAPSCGDSLPRRLANHLVPTTTR